MSGTSLETILQASLQTTTTTTLIEDGCNMCHAFGPVGMHDEVMTPRKSIGNLVEF